MKKAYGTYMTPMTKMNVCIMYVPEGEEKERGIKIIFKIMAENLPNTGKDIYI